MNDYTIKYDYSLRLLQLNSFSKKKIYDYELTAFAPFIDGDLASSLRNCKGDQLAKLACSEDEVNAIGGFFDGKVILGTAANTGKFKESASRSRILHLATHACVNKEESMLSNIFFGEENISAFEIGQLNLNNELTVLSACNSGVGNYKKGEGVYSLARSFIQAGSQSVVMSLWSVNDCKTADIMTSFYKYLLEGKDKSESLRLSKLTYLNEAKTIESHPFYWAPFVQLGNDDPLVFEQKFNHLNTTLVLILIALLLIVRFFLKSKFQEKANLHTP